MVAFFLTEGCSSNATLMQPYETVLLSTQFKKTSTHLGAGLFSSIREGNRTNQKQQSGGLLLDLELTASTP